MTEAASPLTPTRINLHRKSRLLEIGFSDGSAFNYSCEYLRVFAPALSGATDQTPVHDKQRVNIEHLEAEGTAALRLQFDDGFGDSYRWSTLHELGVNQGRNWQDYLQRLASHGLTRGSGDERARIRLLYFIQLAKVSGRDSEQVDIPGSVSDVETLLAWLRKRGEAWNEAFADDRVQVTVNRNFAELYTLVEDGDEVALVPRPG
jgi:DUF971 family protein/molybdopterin converting factor small subunit